MKFWKYIANTYQVEAFFNFFFLEFFNVVLKCGLRVVVFSFSFVGSNPNPQGSYGA